MNTSNNPHDPRSDPPIDPAGAHPSWCSARYCTATPERLLGSRGGAHHSEIVPLRVEATVHGATGMLTGQLEQTVQQPGAGVFLRWLIGTEQVGRLRVIDAAPLALLISAGLGALDDEHLRQS